MYRMRQRFLNASLLLAASVFACAAPPKPKPAAPANLAPTGPAAPAPANIEPTASTIAVLPAGWQRYDLSTQPNPLPISVALPAHATIVTNATPRRDEAGAPIDAPRVRITIDDWWLELAYNEYHRTFASANAMHTQAQPPHAIVHTATAKNATWLVAAEASDHKLFVDAVHPETDVSCETMLVPKHAQRVAFEICLSMQTSRTVPALSLDDSYQFDGLAADRSAQRAAAAAKHAIVSNDAKAFMALVNPNGLLVDKKRTTVKAFTEKAARATLQALLQWPCEQQGDCNWHAPGIGESKNQAAFALYRTSGYGEVRYLRFRKQADGNWLIVEVATEDLGEP